MKFYHGTTLQNAIRIAEMGFLPRKGVVWFTTSKHRAQRRAKQKARKIASPHVCLYLRNQCPRVV